MVFRGYYVLQYYLLNDVSSRESGHIWSLKSKCIFFLHVHDVSLFLSNILASAMLPQRHCPSGFPCGIALHQLLVTHAVVLCIIQYLSEMAVFYWWMVHKKLWPERVLWATCGTLEKKLQFSQSTYFIENKCHLINNLCTKTVTRMNLKINI